MTSSQPTALLHVLRSGDRSVIARAYARSPLRLLTPRNRGGAAWTYMSTLGGGLVDGDCVRLDVRVDAGATALIASQGHARVYRSSRGCRNEVSAEIGDGALLAYMPDPTTCFTGARFEQRLAFTLTPAASLVLVDVLGSGRVASGERWAFERYANDVTVGIGGETIMSERLLLDQRHGSVAERLGRFNVIATVLLAGEAIAPARTALLESIASLPMTKNSPLVESASPIGTGATLLRLAAVSMEDALATLRRRLVFLPPLLGDDPWARRV